MQASVPEAKGDAAPSEYLYCQQWQVSHSLDLKARPGSTQQLSSMPRLSVLSIAGQSYWHNISGRGGASALRALAALQKAATDKRVSKVGFFFA